MQKLETFLIRTVAVAGIVLVLGTTRGWAAEPTLARLSFWMPPERMAEFESAYQQQGRTHPEATRPGGILSAWPRYHRQRLQPAVRARYACPVEREKGGCSKRSGLAEPLARFGDDL